MVDHFITSYCRIKNNTLRVNGKLFFSAPLASEENFISAFYEFTNMNYPKFFKMDNQSKLGLLGTEMLLQENPLLQKYTGEEVGLVFTNAVASDDADKKYYNTIRNVDDYFPSPSLFVYTLANILSGEICIKHKIKGEQAFFISDKFNAGLLYHHINHLMKYTSMKSCISGWVNYETGGLDVFLFTVESMQGLNNKKLSIEVLNQLYSNQ